MKNDLSCLKKYQAKIHIVQPFYSNGDVYIGFDILEQEARQHTFNQSYICDHMHAPLSIVILFLKFLLIPPCCLGKSTILIEKKKYICSMP